MTPILGWPTCYAGIPLGAIGVGLYYDDTGIGFIFAGIGLIVLGLMQVCSK